MSAYTELLIQINANDLDAAQNIAIMAAPYGIYVEDYTDLEQAAREIARVDLIDETLLSRDRSRAAIHVYLSAQDHPAEAAAWLDERLAAENIPHALEINSCRSEDWENNWKAHFHPIPVGERLLIQPAWEPPVDPQGRAVLLIEPGLAFGSGSHATTRLCLQALERAVVPGCAVLDVGCGSGILSVAAMLVGADRVLGVDIDPMAVQSARENAALNCLPCQFTQGDLTAGVTVSNETVSGGTSQFDIIVSNIVADAIVALARQIPRHLKPGGVWISSGIIDTRESDVLQALGANGFHVLERQQEEGWVCLTAGLTSSGHVSFSAKHFSQKLS